MTEEEEYEQYDYMINTSVQKCTACGKMVRHHDYWWMFVSWKCQDCEGAEKTSA